MNKENSIKLSNNEEFFLNESQRVANVGSYLLDIKTGYWTSSKQLDKIFGIGDDYERNVEGWFEIVHPEYREVMSDYFNNEVLKRGVKFDKEYKIVRKNDNQEAWVHGLGELVFDENKNPVKMLGTIQDISERKRNNENICRHNEELEKMNELMINRESRIIELKEEIAELKKKNGIED